jgi:hypothetical protein
LDLDNTCVDDADTARPAQANDRPLLNHNVCLPSDNNTDGYNQDPTEIVQFLEHDGMPLVSHRLSTTEHTSSKRMQALQGGRASKRTRLEPQIQLAGTGVQRTAALVLIQKGLAIEETNGSLVTVSAKDRSRPELVARQACLLDVRRV